jgi:hypothetical protein
VEDLLVVILFGELCEGLFLFEEGIGRISLQSFKLIVVYLDILEILVHAFSDKFFKPIILVFDSLIFVSNGLVFLLLKISETFLELLSIFKLPLYELGI